MSNQPGIARFTCILLATLLSACNGGSSGGGGGGNGGDELSNVPSGLYRAEFSFAVDFSLMLGGTTTRLQTTGDLTALGSWTNNAPNPSVFDFCEPEGPVMVSDDDPGEADPSGCLSYDYTETRLSDTSFQIEENCDGFGTVAILTLVRSDPSFDQGSLSMTSNAFPNLDATAGVCGQIGSSTTTTTETPPGPPTGVSTFTESTFQVGAPYESTRLVLRFFFGIDPLVPGTYSVAIDPSVQPADGVDVILTSSAFGGTPDNPDEIDGSGGTVTITSASDTAVAGSYDVTSGAGLTFSGSFDLDLTR